MTFGERVASLIEMSIQVAQKDIQKVQLMLLGSNTFCEDQRKGLEFPGGQIETLSTLSHSHH